MVAFSESFGFHFVQHDKKQYVLEISTPFLNNDELQNESIVILSGAKDLTI
jgi:hypothetical protein